MRRHPIPGPDFERLHPDPLALRFRRLDPSLPQAPQRLYQAVGDRGEEQMIRLEFEKFEPEDLA